MLALAIGTLLVVVALGYVLYPLVFAPAAPSMRPTFSRAVARTPDGDEDAIAALRKIEFDRATGKLSDSHYGPSGRSVRATRIFARPGTPTSNARSRRGRELSRSVSAPELADACRNNVSFFRFIVMIWGLRLARDTTF